MFSAYAKLLLILLATAEAVRRSLKTTPSSGMFRLERAASRAFVGLLDFAEI